jgi:protein-tyrosine phosphatase
MQGTVQIRRLSLEGAINVRDIGGYPTLDGRRTRWGAILRGDSLHRLTESDQRILRETYGVRSIVDLRRESERDFAPSVYLDSTDVVYRPLPIFDDTAGAPPAEPRTLELVYRGILDTRKERVGAVFRSLIEPRGLPALIHCTAGKDRTGLIIALILGLAGVSDAKIAEDYALTASYLTPEYYVEARGRAERAGYRWEDYQKLLVCPPELMSDTLVYLRATYGSPSRYLAACGLSAIELSNLREAILEPTVN